jgi:Ankyrin repeats (3 copies)
VFAFRPLAWVWIVAGVFLATGVAPAADPAVALIDQLPALDRQDIGYSGSVSGTAFLPFGRNESGVVLLSPRQGKSGSSDAMRSLVKLGVKAVPALLDHLSDDRPTKIVIDSTSALNGFKKTKYTVRVGDLCYVALGQIVNREYTAVRYIPTAIVIVGRVPENKQLHADLTKEWGKLTADLHRDALVQDFGSDNGSVREGAAVRLAYYYPDVLEPLVLKQLARPAYDTGAVDDFLRDKLYPAKTAKERKELTDEFVKANGEIAHDGLRWELFDRFGSPFEEKRPKARECLIDVFGFTDKVTTKDGPKNRPLSMHTHGSLIDSLLYDRSAKIDQAIRDILAKTDSVYMGFICMNRLVGRGYDADIEAHLKRRLAIMEERYREPFKEYEAKYGWTWLHKVVQLDIPDLTEAALKEAADVNAKAKDGRTALHVAAAEGTLGAVKQLLAANADRKAKDEKGRTPLDLAKERKHTAVVKLLSGSK